MVYRKKVYVPKDKDGWTNANLYKPDPFDLVYLMDDKGKCQTGWWTGTIWDYYQKKINNVYLWKRAV